MRGYLTEEFFNGRYEPLYKMIIDRNRDFRIAANHAQFDLTQELSIYNAPKHSSHGYHYIVRVPFNTIQTTPTGEKIKWSKVIPVRWHEVELIEELATAG